MTRKEELIEELRKIRAEERAAFSAEHMSRIRALVGRYFALRNDYGSGTAWKTHVRVNGVADDHAEQYGENMARAMLRMSSIETDCEGVVHVAPEFEEYSSFLDGAEETTAEQWETAVDEAMRALSDMKTRRSEAEQALDAYGRWIELRGASEDESGEKLCYCGHTYKCSCGDPDPATFFDAVERGAVKPDDPQNGWETACAPTEE